MKGWTLFSLIDISLMFLLKVYILSLNQRRVTTLGTPNKNYSTDKFLYSHCEYSSHNLGTLLSLQKSDYPKTRSLGFHQMKQTTIKKKRSSPSKLSIGA